VSTGKILYLPWWIQKEERKDSVLGLNDFVKIKNLYSEFSQGARPEKSVVRLKIEEAEWKGCISLI